MSSSPLGAAITRSSARYQLESPRGPRTLSGCFASRPLSTTRMPDSPGCRHPAAGFPGAICTWSPTQATRCVPPFTAALPEWCFVLLVCRRFPPAGRATEAQPMARHPDRSGGDSSPSCSVPAPNHGSGWRPSCALRSLRVGSRIHIIRGRHAPTSTPCSSTAAQESAVLHSPAEAEPEPLAPLVSGDRLRRRSEEDPSCLREDLPCRRRSGLLSRWPSRFGLPSRRVLRSACAGEHRSQ